MMRSSLRALGAVVLAGTIAACTNSTAPGIVRSMPVALNTAPPTKLPVVDLSATPAGWVPVAYGDAQVSVPPSFPVVYPGLTSFCKRASASGPGGFWSIYPQVRRSTVLSSVIHHGLFHLGSSPVAHREEVHPAQRGYGSTAS